MDVADRARIHAALGDPARLRIVDALSEGDGTFRELADIAGLPTNAAAHHLLVLESAGLIERRVSEGDRRRRYISLRPAPLAVLDRAGRTRPGVVLFVCSHNSARSQVAAAMWRSRTGGTADSAGSEPAARVHPTAIRVASEFGLDLTGASPKGYDVVSATPDLVVSVCDRARESGVPFRAPAIHWSIPDPVPVGTIDAFRAAFAELSGRVDRLAASTRPSTA